MCWSGCKWLPSHNAGADIRGLSAPVLVVLICALYHTVTVLQDDGLNTLMLYAVRSRSAQSQTASARLLLSPDSAVFPSDFSVKQLLKDGLFHWSGLLAPQQVHPHIQHTLHEGQGRDVFSEVIGNS